MADEAVGRPRVQQDGDASQSFPCHQQAGHLRLVGRVDPRPRPEGRLSACRGRLGLESPGQRRHTLIYSIFLLFRQHIRNHPCWCPFSCPCCPFLGCRRPCNVGAAIPVLPLVWGCQHHSRREEARRGKPLLSCRQRAAGRWRRWENCFRHPPMWRTLGACLSRPGGPGPLLLRCLGTPVGRQATPPPPFRAAAAGRRGGLGPVPSFVETWSRQIGARNQISCPLSHRRRASVAWAVDVSDTIVNDILPTCKASIVLSPLDEFSLVVHPMLTVASEVFRRRGRCNSFLS